MYKKQEQENFSSLEDNNKKRKISIQENGKRRTQKEYIFEWFQIDNVSKSKDLITEWLNIQGKISTTLIYRATDNGFKATDFHQNCDNKGANLVIILNEFGYIFGGYTSVCWDNAGYKKDHKAFLYSINNKAKFNVKQGQNAICCSQYYGPYYASAKNDLLIFGCSNINNSSYADVSRGYELGSGYDGKTVLSGQRNFKVQDIEVFAISYD